MTGVCDSTNNFMGTAYANRTPLYRKSNQYKALIISGESGIGKTTLVESACRDLGIKVGTLIEYFWCLRWKKSIANITQNSLKSKESTKTALNQKAWSQEITSWAFLGRGQRSQPFRSKMPKRCKLARLAKAGSQRTIKIQRRQRRLKKKKKRSRSKKYSWSRTLTVSSVAKIVTKRKTIPSLSAKVC